MYTGTVIEELFELVARAEEHARTSGRMRARPEPVFETLIEALPYYQHFHNAPYVAPTVGAA